MLDPVAVERAEKSLDEFINSRSKAKDKANAEEVMYAESVRIHHAKRLERNRWEWVRFFDRMALSHRELSEDYERRAEGLLQEAAQMRMRSTTR